MAAAAAGSGEDSSAAMIGQYHSGRRESGMLPTGY